MAFQSTAVPLRDLPSHEPESAATRKPSNTYDLVTNTPRAIHNWAERGHITAKYQLTLQRGGMADVSQIPPRWAPSKCEVRREATRRVFDE